MTDFLIMFGVASVFVLGMYAYGWVIDKWSKR